MWSEPAAANRRRALEALGADPGSQVEASQVHGRAVAVVGREERGLCRVDLFFSHRRDGVTGRMVAMIGLV